MKILLNLLAEENPMWITMRDQEIPLSEMSTGHILNTLRAWEGNGLSNIPSYYNGDYLKWKRLFHNELIKRGHSLDFITKFVNTKVGYDIEY